ncbi:MAG: hypothetical protein ACUVRC_03650 [Desulfotomaculales bacterium]
MRVWYLACIVAAAAAVLYHASLCLDFFNRVVAPPEPVRLVEVRRLNPEHVAVDFLGLRVVLAVPDRAFPVWHPVKEH